MKNNNFEKNYCKILKNCIKSGTIVDGRNGKTIILSGQTIKTNINEGLPIVTGKKIFPKSCFFETEWILKGYTNNLWLNDKGVHIWDQWADKNGDLGPIYGKQLRDFNGVDQLKLLIKKAKENIYDRRLICNLWNPCDIDKMALPPCHFSFQFVAYQEYVDIIVSMRSLDLFIGFPYDVLMYSIILSSFCKEVGLKANNVIINAANAHIYYDHIFAVEKYLKSKKHNLPKLLNVPKILSFNADEIKISDYKSNNRIIVEVKK